MGHATRLAPLFLPLLACSVSRGVRPLGDGVTAVTATAGGPMADYLGSMKPLPIGTVGVRHGLTDAVDVHGAVNWGTLAFFGLFGAEVGAGWMFLEPDGARPALMGDLTLDLFAGDLSSGPPDGGLRAFTELDLRASWAYGAKEHLIYTGPTVLTQPAPFVNRGAWSVGNQLTFKKADLITELKWLAPMQDSKAASIDFGGIGGQGALSIQLGGRIKFGGPQ